MQTNGQKDGWTDLTACHHFSWR